MSLGMKEREREGRSNNTPAALVAITNFIFSPLPLMTLITFLLFALRNFMSVCVCVRVYINMISSLVRIHTGNVTKAKKSMKFMNLWVVAMVICG
jgi:hypothetical protein